MSDVLCKGSWALTSACGRCARCIEEAPKYIAHLQSERNALADKLANLRHITPSPYTLNRDVAIPIKCALFDELARQLHFEPEVGE